MPAQTPHARLYPASHKLHAAPSVQVSFIIPLYNCLSLTQAMLASLRTSLPPQLAHEIIFVDDGSSDGTREWLGKLFDPRCRVVLNERNVGYAAANNRGAAIACGDLLALLNNDLVLPSGWFEPMLATHRALHPRAGLVGNVQRDATTGSLDHTGIVINEQGKPIHLRVFPSQAARARREYWLPPAVTGACVLIERALWQQLGGFDEAYVNGGEDIDLCFRARAAGRVNAVALKSVVRHHVSSSPGRKLRDEQNSYRLARKWRNEFIAAADYGTRRWCRAYLARTFPMPDPHQHRLTVAACAYLARLRRRPPPEAVAGIEIGLAREFARWETMFGG